MSSTNRDCENGNSDPHHENESRRLMVDHNLDKTLERIARNALRRRRRAAPSNRVTAMTHNMVQRLPNSESLDQSEIVAYVARNLRGVIQSGNAAGAPEGVDHATSVRKNHRTMLAN